MVDISASFFACERLRVAPVLREVAGVMDAAGPAVAVLSRSLLCLPITTPSGHLTTLDFADLSPVTTPRPGKNHSFSVPLAKLHSVVLTATERHAEAQKQLDLLLEEIAEDFDEVMTAQFAQELTEDIRVDVFSSKGDELP